MPLLALMMIVVPTAASAQAAPAAKLMHGACAKKSSGQLRYVARARQCRRHVERAVRFSAAKPVLACARRGGGVYRVGSRAACARGANRPSLALELPSADKHDFCAQNRSGRLRSTEHVPYPGQGGGGGGGERPGGGGGGKDRGPCKRDERRVVLAAVDFAPDVEEDVATVSAAAPAAIDVLANDRDPEGGAVTVAGVDRRAAVGDVTVAAGARAIAYDPAGRFQALGAGASATERFTYTATDGKRASEPADVTVTVTGVNDAPTAVADAASTSEDAPIVLRPAANDTDPDAGDAVIVAAAAGPGVTRNPDGTVTYDPTGRLDQLAAGAQHTDRIAYTASDGHGGTAAGEVVVQVTGIDDAPAMTASAGSATFGEGGAPVAVDPGLTVTDADSSELDGATVAVVAGGEAADVLGFSDQSGITGSFDAGTGVLTLTGSASVADYQAALRSVTFSAAGANPSAAARTIRFRAATGTPVTRQVAVATIDDAPVITTTGGALAYTENDPATAVDPGLTVSDVDSPQLAGATVRVATGGFVNSGDVLAFTPQSGITGSYAALTGTLTLSGGASPAAYQAALRSVTYANTSESPSGALRFVDFRVDDGTVPSATASRSVTVAPLPDAPVMTTSAGSATFVEGGSPVAVDPGLTAADADSAVIGGAEVEITAGTRHAGDVLAFPGAAGITGSFAAGVLTLSGDAPVADYQAALRSVTFSNPGATPGSTTRTVRFRATDDGGATSAYAARDVAVTDTNAAPVVTPTAGTTAFTEGDAATPVDPTLTVADADSSQLAGATVQISGNHDAADALSVPSQNGITGTYVPATGTLTLAGAATVAQYQAALRDVRFANADDTPATTERTVSFQADDGAATDHLSNVATRAVSVAATDDPPVAVDDAATVGEDAGATGIDVLANDTDPDGGPASITAKTNGTHGTVVITGGGTGVTYAPDANSCGPDTFTYTITGGDTATVTVTVTCVDDLPVAVDDTATVAEDAPATAIDVLANDPDVDGGAKAITAKTNGTHGTVAITGGGTGLTYVPDANSCGTDTFDYTITGGDTATVTVTVTCVDDLPAAVDDAATIAEDAAATAVDVRANDTDVDGGPKSVTAKTNGTHGSVAITGGGTGLTYAPDADYCGPDSFTYTLNGGSAATVTMTVTCVNDAPVADDEAIGGGIGNTTLVVDDPTDGAPSVATPSKTVGGDLLAGDTDVDGPGALTIQPATIATADGGQVTIDADGDFTYRPAAGCPDASDSFDYTVTDGTLTDTGSVTIGVADCVWYVDDSAAPGGDGRSHAPFGAVAALGGADPDRADDTIFLSTGTYPGALALENGQRLISERHGLVVGGTTLVPATGAGATLGGTLTLGDDNTIQGVAVNNPGGTALAGTTVGTATMNTVTPGTLAGAPAVNINGGTLDMRFDSVTSTGSATGAIVLTGVGGTFTAPAGSLQNATGADVQLSGGNLAFTYGGSISDASGTAVSVASTTGGLKDFNGSVTGATVALTSNTGATVRFDGGLTLSSGSAPAFTASGGGTVAVTGGSNALQTGTGTPLTVTNTTIDGEDLTFRSIASSGAANGIVLTNTGAGGLAVTGTGSLDSGGTIATSSGAGVQLDTVPGGVSLTRMRVTGGLDDGVRGTNVAGLVLDNTRVTGNGNAVGEHGLDLSGLTGTASLTAATVTGNFERNVQVVDDAGTLTLNVTGGTYADTDESLGSDGIAVEGTGTGTLNVTIQGATFSNNRDDHVQVTTDGSTSVAENVTIAGNTMTNPIGEDGGGITLNPGGNAVMKATLSNNSIQGARNEAITVDAPGSRANPQPVTIHATIQGNTIGAAGTAMSGASAGNGIGIRSNGNAAVRALVENNRIYQYANLAGLHLVNNDGDGTLDATVRNTTIAAPAAGGQNAILAVTGGADPVEHATSCLDIGSVAAPLMNEVLAGGSEQPGGEDIRIRQRDATTVRLPGYPGGATDTAAVGTFVAGRNSRTGTPTVVAVASGSGGGFVNATCALPQP